MISPKLLQGFKAKARAVVPVPTPMVDLRAAYPLGQTLEIYARVENLFDKTYSTIYQYGTLGRTGFVGLRAKY